MSQDNEKTANPTFFPALVDLLGTKDILIRYHYEQIPYVTNPRASGLARVPRGCVVAVRTSDLVGEPPTIRFGWSWCRRDEQFNRKTAVRIAYYRAFGQLGSLAYEGAVPGATLPRALRPLYERVVEIAERRWLARSGYVRSKEWWDTLLEYLGTPLRIGSYKKDGPA